MVITPKLLVFIQNPWARGALKRWDLNVWDNEVQRSRFWKHLMQDAIGEIPFEVHYTNVDTVNIGSDSRVEADISHMCFCILKLKPDIVLACGEFARNALRDERVHATLDGVAAAIGIDRMYGPFASAHEIRGAHEYLLEFHKRFQTKGCFEEQ